MMRRISRILASAAILTVGMFWISPVGPASATETQRSSATSGDAVSSQSLAKPGPSRSKGIGPKTSCSTVKNGLQLCLSAAAPKTTDPTPRSSRTESLRAWPEICAESLAEGGVVFADSRLQACRQFSAVLTTTRTTGGVTTITGEAFLNFLDLTYSDANSGTWHHQTGVYATSGYGDAISAQVSAVSTVVGVCSASSESFDTGAIQPFNEVRTGELLVVTDATPVGAIGNCTTRWSYGFFIGGYPTVSTTNEMSEVRCDNASGASRGRPVRVGCVIPWYPAAVIYSRSLYPSLASHVSRAQGSGLPGATLNAPLTRSTDGTVEATNRRLACGDAPSIAGRSCDEYPLATTRNGLAFGGSRRTFGGCDINAPTGVTGPTGASACMITDTENSAQGGLMSGFYYDWRVLDGDPYRVLIGS